MIKKVGKTKIEIMQVMKDGERRSALVVWKILNADDRPRPLTRHQVWYHMMSLEKAGYLVSETGKQHMAAQYWSSGRELGEGMNEFTLDQLEKFWPSPISIPEGINITTHRMDE